MPVLVKVGDRILLYHDECCNGLTVFGSDEVLRLKFNVQDVSQQCVNT